MALYYNGLPQYNDSRGTTGVTLSANLLFLLMAHLITIWKIFPVVNWWFNSDLHIGNWVPRRVAIPFVDGVCHHAIDGKCWVDLLHTQHLRVGTIAGCNPFECDFMLTEQNRFLHCPSSQAGWYLYQSDHRIQPDDHAHSRHLD